MGKIKAYIESIIYYNEDNHYAVLSVSEGEKEETVVGYFPYISAGETIEAEGDYIEHPLYGEQFQAKEFKVVEPEGVDAIERYLAGGAIRGIGPALAKKIVKRFKNDTFRIIEEEPERLQEIKGISERIAREIAEQMETKRGMRDAVIFMQEYGISSNLANKIYDKYGPSLYSVIEGNPYKIAEDIDGVGFKLADSIARRAGLAEDSEFRIKSGIEYALYYAQTNGHTWLPKSELIRYTLELLELRDKEINLELYLADMQIAGKIICTGREQDEVYLSSLYYMEKNTALMLDALNIKGESDEAFVTRRIMRIQSGEDIVLDDKQAEAIKASVDNGVLIITGGPGTGKTTTINTIIKYYEEDNLDIALAAPTGRAAKRMSEATGYEAKTIHRLLEYTGAPEDADEKRIKNKFLRDEKDPLEADVVIVDEMSMVDIYLMEALLKAIVPGTRLILVGDANQLPSVGAGNVLKDLIASEAYRTVCLTHIFRQAAMSDIVVNAHKINNGEPVELGKPSKDFLFIKCAAPQGILDAVKTLMLNKLPKYVNCSVSEIQVLTPTRKGVLGVENLNTELQRFLNPQDRSKTEKKSGDMVFRLGDKVMQIKNNYDMKWERRNRNGISYASGVGVFNGDIGVIVDIDKAAEQITVLFDDERFVVYESKNVEELELAYAVTVHKSQGSEYPAVIMPMYYGPHMLMNRNLLYTAVTRAKKCVCIVGLPQVFNEMEHNDHENMRYSGLKARIKEAESGFIMEEAFVSDMDNPVFDEEMEEIGGEI